MKSPFHTCLLIDDNPLDNYINTLLVTRNAFADEVIAKVSAKEVLTSIKEGSIKPDVIFLDLRMPLMDGFQFLIEYGKLKHINKSTNIYVLSSSVNPSDISRCEHHKNVVKFIEKPLTDAKLLDIINITNK